MRSLIALCLAFAIAPPALAQTPGETVRFLSCPVYRDVDAGRKSGCWLTDQRETGVRYDVTQAPTKPDWNHEILVEGVVSSETDQCGGVVLNPVRVSVMPGVCTRQLLPAEGMKGVPFKLPPRNVRPLHEARAAPENPDQPATFHIMFDFNRDFIVYQLSDYLFDMAVAHIRGVSPARINVTGYAATTPAKVSGQTIAEDAAIAKRRAQTITDALVRMGVDPEIIRTRWKTGAKPADAPGADGLVEASRRRVEIEVIP